jgi:hypothetical protein
VLKKSWLLLPPLIASMIGLGASPSQATGENWVVKNVVSTGCDSGNWNLTTVFSGVDGGSYTAHTLVTSGGLSYMNEDATFAPTDGADEPWSLYTSSTYGPITGTYPITPGQPMKAVFTLERPKGTVLSSWTMVAKSCDSATLLYNGATSADLDGDYVPTPADKCPTLAAARRADGCPLRARSLALKTKSDPRRVVGKLHAAGHPALDRGLKVKIWKVRPGADRVVARLVTNRHGKFKAQLSKGRYYATAAAHIAPAAGEAKADRSRIRRLH